MHLFAFDLRSRMLFKRCQGEHDSYDGWLLKAISTLDQLLVLCAHMLSMRCVSISLWVGIVLFSLLVSSSLWKTQVKPKLRSMMHHAN